MTAKAACIDDVNKVLEHLETDRPVKPLDDKGLLPHVQPQSLACTLLMTLVQKTAQHSATSCSHEREWPRCKSRSEKEALRKRIYHQKLRDERSTLRKTVKDLTLKLEELQRGTRTASLGLVHSRWQTMAVEEREKRHRSEAEQTQLLEAAESKALSIRELLQHVSGPVTTETAFCTSQSDDKAKESTTLPTLPPFDFTMFRGHLRRVHEGYTQTDTVLDFEAMADGVVTSCKRRESDNEVAYFERRQKFSEPFSYARTQQTMWKLGKLTHRQQDREDFGQVAGSDDISVVRYRVLQTLATGMTVSVIKRYVARRFAEDKRTVYVWKTHSEGEGIFCGMHSDETGWIRIQPGVDESVTDVLSCIRQVPLKVGISTYQVEDFHELLQSSVHEDMTELTNSLDKLLLEDTLADIDI